MRGNVSMVSEQNFRGRRIFVCEECGFGYAEKVLAIQCEAFCKKMGQCSTEITKLAVMKPIA